MASVAAASAIEALLAANWSHTPIFYPNTSTLVPDDGSAFLVIEYPVAAETQISLGAIGTRVFRETGSFVITLCGTIGVGSNPGATPYATWIDTLRAVFRGQQFSGVNTLGPSPTHFEQSSDRGAYCEFSFATEFYFDLQG